MGEPAQTPPGGASPDADGGTTPARPDYVAEEHWDAETGSIKSEPLAKAYKDLRTKMSREGAPPKVSGGEQGAAPQIGAGPDIASAGDINEFLQGVGLDGRELAERFASRGELTRGQYDALERAKIPRPLVDRYLAAELENVQVRVEKARGACEQFAQGADRLDNLIAWAGANYDAAQVRDMNTRLADPATMLRAVKEIYADHQVAVGAGGAQPLIQGGQPPGGGSGGYRSQAEVNAAMSNPKYNIDPAYTDEVNAKLQATPESVLGIG